MKVFEIDLEVNPLLKQNYNALSVDLKVYIYIHIYLFIYLFITANNALIKSINF